MSKDNFSQIWYGNLPDAPNIRAFAEHIGTHLSLPKNHIIVRAGDVPSCCYVILSGSIAGFEYTATFEERSYVFDHFASSGILLLDAHVITGYPVPVTIRTQTDAELIQITRGQLLQFLYADPEYALEIIYSTSYKFFSAVDQLREARCNKTSAIISKLFLGLAHRYGTASGDKIIISKPFTQQELANLLGVNRITFIRVIKELRELGLIEVNDHLYCIPSIQKLKEFIEKDEPYG